MMDDISASYTAVNHLISSGRKRIAICTGNLNLLISQNRLKGYTSALENAGLQAVEEYIVSCEWPEEAEAAMYSLFSLPDPPDAVFTISDLTTSGTMRAMYRMKKKIPEEVAIIGVCEKPFRSLYYPALTSIEPKGYDIGKVAAEILLDRIEKESSAYSGPHEILLQGDLIVKDST
jgi:LacI family transcriptional regulator